MVSALHRRLPSRGLRTLDSKHNISQSRDALLILRPRHWSDLERWRVAFGEHGHVARLALLLPSSVGPGRMGDLVSLWWNRNFETRFVFGDAENAMTSQGGRNTGII